MNKQSKTDLSDQQKNDEKTEEQDTHSEITNEITLESDSTDVNTEVQDTLESLKKELFPNKDAMNKYLPGKEYTLKNCIEAQKAIFYKTEEDMDKAFKKAKEEGQKAADQARKAALKPAYAKKQNEYSKAAKKYDDALKQGFYDQKKYTLYNCARAKLAQLSMNSTLGHYHDIDQVQFLDSKVVHEESLHLASKVIEIDEITKMKEKADVFTACLAFAVGLIYYLTSDFNDPAEIGFYVFIVQFLTPMLSTFIVDLCWNKNGKYGLQRKDNKDDSLQGCNGFNSCKPKECCGALGQAILQGLVIYINNQLQQNYGKVMGKGHTKMWNAVSVTVIMQIYAMIWTKWGDLFTAQIRTIYYEGSDAFVHEYKHSGGCTCSLREMDDLDIDQQGDLTDKSVQMANKVRAKLTDPATTTTETGGQITEADTITQVKQNVSL